MVFSPVLPICPGVHGVVQPPAFQTLNPGVWHQGRGGSTAVAVGPSLPVSYSSAGSAPSGAGIVGGVCGKVGIKASN